MTKRCVGVSSDSDSSVLQIHPELVAGVAPDIRESGEACGVQLNRVDSTFWICIVVWTRKQCQDPNLLRVSIQWLVDHLPPVFCFIQACHGGCEMPPLHVLLFVANVTCAGEAVSFTKPRIEERSLDVRSHCTMSRAATNR